MQQTSTCGLVAWGATLRRRVRDIKVDADSIHRQNGLHPSDGLHPSVCIRKAGGAFVGQLPQGYQPAPYHAIVSTCLSGTMRSLSAKIMLHATCRAIDNRPQVSNLPRIVSARRRLSESIAR